MPGAIMHGRTVEYAIVPYAVAPTSAGIFGDTPDASKTFIQICTDQLPEIRQARNEVEATTTCDSAKVYVAGMKEGQPWQVSGVFQGANAGDYGSGANTLVNLAKAQAGTVIAVRDTTTQWGAQDIVHRFNVVLLGSGFGGGALGELQKWMAEGRISGDIDVRTA